MLFVSVDGVCKLLQRTRIQDDVWEHEPALPCSSLMARSAEARSAYVTNAQPLALSSLMFADVTAAPEDLMQVVLSHALIHIPHKRCCIVGVQVAGVELACTMPC